MTIHHLWVQNDPSTLNEIFPQKKPNTIILMYLLAPLTMQNLPEVFKKKQYNFHVL